MMALKDVSDEAGGMMSERLTDQQRTILDAMLANDGIAAFNGDNSRRLGFGLIPAKHGGIIVRAYGIPEHALRARKMIEVCERNVPGTWFRITDKGRNAVRKPDLPDNSLTDPSTMGGERE